MSEVRRQDEKIPEILQVVRHSERRRQPFKVQGDEMNDNIVILFIILAIALTISLQLYLVTYDSHTAEVVAEAIRSDAYHHIKH